ncbi:MAG: hypothetical protein LR015_01410 [Verrucomicrobia bacterium]|nr:hypothetical protein [Verrucomicrobiota bacterium]
MRSIQAAVLRAQQDSAAGIGSRIVLHPGVYREIIDITNRVGNMPLTLEALEPGTVTISGSDIFNQWQPVAGMPDVFSHQWTYKFGWEPNPCPGIWRCVIQRARAASCFL